MEEGDFLYLRGEIIQYCQLTVVQKYCPRPLPYCYWECNKKEMPPSVEGKWDLIDGDFLERIEVKGE